MILMATIRPNDNAPTEDVKYIFPTVTFDLASGASYETDDREALAAAEAHPWLTVEYPVLDEVAVSRISRSVPPQQDHLSSLYEGDTAGAAFDPERIQEAEAAKVEVFAQPLAVEAGQDQSEPVEEGGVAETLAVERSTELGPLVPVSDDQPAPGEEKE